MTVLTETRRRFLHIIAGVSAWVVGTPLNMPQAKAQDQDSSDKIKTRLFETKWIDLNRKSGSAKEIISLSEVKDRRRSEVVLLPENATLYLGPNICNDIYVLKGHLFEQKNVYLTGTFVRRCNETNLIAGSKGAMFFIYCDQIAQGVRNETVIPNDLEWYQGGAEGMEVALLFEDTHQLMVVSWLPGTKMGFHTHPRGEEIFVLEGELRDQQGRYPAGTWQRLYPGTSHAPYAEVKTLILLRNGHLHSEQISSNRETLV